MVEKKEKLCGFDIDTSSQDELTRFILEEIKGERNVHVVTINPEMIQLAEKNQKFCEILKRVELLIPDGVGIKIAFKLRGKNINRIAGIEFAKNILKEAAINKLPVALVGAKDEILQAAASNLRKELPELNIVYQRDGFFGEADETQIIQNIKDMGAKVVLVALGVPKQEFFIEQLKEAVTGGVFIGVGGSFDVWSGYVKRAPVIFQKMGLEWLYRVLMQPSRFKRIFPTLPLFLFRVIINKGKE